MDRAFGLQLEEPPAPEASAPGPAEHKSAERPVAASTIAPAAEASPFDPPPAAVLASRRPRPAVVTPEPEPSAEKSEVDDFILGAGGGMLVLKGGRLQPAVVLDLGWNLGSVLGWPGLFVKVDTDLFIGSSPLGADYIMIDALAGFDGRFRLGAVRLSAGLGFGLRHMSVTKQAPSSFSEPELGFGAGLRAGFEWPFWRFLSLAIDAEGRYTKDPLSGQFVFSGVISGGLRFVIQAR